MYPDPVVDEIRRHAAKIAEECDGDVHRMAQRFRREQAKNPHQIVRRTLPPDRRVDPGISPKT